MYSTVNTIHTSMHTCLCTYVNFLSTFCRFPVSYGRPSKQTIYCVLLSACATTSALASGYGSNFIRDFLIIRANCYFFRSSCLNIAIKTFNLITCVYQFLLIFTFKYCHEYEFARIGLMRVAGGTSD
jgi:hypothetical protein